MGLAANLARQLMLTARVHDIEIQERFLLERKLFLSQRLSQMLFASLNRSLDPASPAARHIQIQQRMVEEEEKRIDIVLRKLQAMKEAIQQELQALDKVIQKNVEIFGIMGRG